MRLIEQLGCVVIKVLNSNRFQPGWLCRWIPIRRIISLQLMKIVRCFNISTYFRNLLIWNFLFSFLWLWLTYTLPDLNIIITDSIIIITCMCICLLIFSIKKITSLIISHDFSHWMLRHRKSSLLKSRYSFIGHHDFVQLFERFHLHFLKHNLKWFWPQRIISVFIQFVNEISIYSFN